MDWEDFFLGGVGILANYSIYKLLHCLLEPEECVMFVNAGGEAPNEVDSSMKILGDTYYDGGHGLRTNEPITEAGDCPFIYQSARLGNFCYRFTDLPPGDYFIDLHFAEIINTNGPKGMRVFNVYIQEEKASHFKQRFKCIYSHYLVLKLIIVLFLVFLLLVNMAGPIRL